MLQDLAKLKHRMINWLFFWRAVNWRQNKKPFLLLASAETTLGVSTILTMVKNRIWHWQRTAAQRLQSQAVTGPAQQRLQRALNQWQHLQRQHTGPAGRLIQLLQQVARQRQQQGRASRLASGLTTLYQLGIETNQQMMQEVLGNFEVGTTLECVITARQVLSVQMHARQEMHTWNISCSHVTVNGTQGMFLRCCCTWPSAAAGPQGVQRVVP